MRPCFHTGRFIHNYWHLRLLQYSAPKYSRERLHHNMQTLAIGGGSERAEERLNKVPQSCTTVLQMTGQVADFGTIIAFTL